MIPTESPIAVPTPGHRNVPTRAPVGTNIAIYNEPSFKSSSKLSDSRMRSTELDDFSLDRNF